MKKMLLIILLTVIVFVGGYFIYNSISDYEKFNTYKNDEFGISFKYPKDFEIVTDETIYNKKVGGGLSDHGWRKIKLQNTKVLEKPLIYIEIDAGGHGRVTPTRIYDIDWNNGIVINSVKEYERPEDTEILTFSYLDDGIVIYTDIVKPPNEHEYIFEFYQDKGNKDYEYIFREFLRSVVLN